MNDYENDPKNRGRRQLLAGAGLTLANLLWPVEAWAQPPKRGEFVYTNTPPNKMSEIVSVKDFGAVGDGVTNDKAAVVAAYAAHNHVRFPAGTYNMGNMGSREVMVDIQGGASSVSLLTDGLVTFKCNTTGNFAPIFFRFRAVDGLKIGTVAFEDTGTNIPAGGTPWRGAIGISIEASDTTRCKNIKIDAIHGKTVGQPIQLIGSATSLRIENVDIGLIEADTCYRGFNAQNNGDHVRIGLLRTRSVVRSYFVYGCKHHNVNIFSTNNLATSGDCNISTNVSAAGRDTEDLEIRLRRQNGGGLPILLAAFGEGRSSIRNIKLDVNLDEPTARDVMLIRAYNLDGTVENMGATNNIFDRIRVNGRIFAPLAPKHIKIRCRPITKGIMEIGGGIPMSTVDSTVHTNFNLGVTGSWTPVPTFC